MSYMKFDNIAMSDEMGRVEKATGPARNMDEHGRVSQAERTVFDQWLTEERFEELVYWLHSNYDSGGGDEYINRLSQKLIELRDVRLLKRLWRGVITIRTEAYWSSRRYSEVWPNDKENEAREKKQAHSEP